MISIIYSTPQQVTQQLAERVKARRLAENWSRKTLSVRSGVPESTIKRFELTGQISLEALLMLAMALDAMQEFDALFPQKMAHSIEQIQAIPRQRGRT